MSALVVSEPKLAPAEETALDVLRNCLESTKESVKYWTEQEVGFINGLARVRSRRSAAIDLMDDLEATIASLVAALAKI